MRTPLPLSVATLLFASFCHAFLGNFGRTQQEQQQHQNDFHQHGEGSFGEVNLPLGNQDDYRGNMWSQESIDPHMYSTTYHQQYPHSSELQMPYGGRQAHQDDQNYPQVQSGYDLPPQSGYELPPGYYNPTGNFDHTYQPSATKYGNQPPPMSPAMSYQSFGQPRRTYRDHSTMDEADDEYPHDDDDDQPSPWATGVSSAQAAGAMPEQTQALDRLHLGGRGQVQNAAERRRAMRGNRAARVKASKAAADEEWTREDETLMESPSPSSLREPSTARRSTAVRGLTTEETKKIVEEQFQQRHLHPGVHPQIVAAQASEIKTAYPGSERSIANHSKRMVESWKPEPEYLFDYTGWSTFYRNRINTLRRALNDRMYPDIPTAEQMEKYVLENYRDLRTNFHGTLADPVQDLLDVHLATQAWVHFKQTRLYNVIHSDHEVTMDKIFRYMVGFRFETKTCAETQTLIKKYLRSVLHFPYTEIEYLGQRLRQEEDRMGREG